MHLLKQELLKRSESPFDGEPYKFHAWITLLKHRIKDIPVDSIDVINILINNATGEPHKMIQSYLALMCDNPDGTLEKNRSNASPTISIVFESLFSFEEKTGVLPSD